MAAGGANPPCASAARSPPPSVAPPGGETCKAPKVGGAPAGARVIYTRLGGGGVLGQIGGARPLRSTAPCAFQPTATRARASRVADRMARTTLSGSSRQGARGSWCV